MVEKFSDYEGQEYISEEGSFVFTIDGYELKDSSKGEPMAVFTVKSDKGSSTIYHSLVPKARWSYNKLIKCCLHDRLDTDEKIAAFECDYQTIGQELVGKKFIGKVEQQTYEKPVKKALDDGTFEDAVEEKISYKITDYDFIK